MSAPRILVADDNPLSLRFLVDALAATGADVGEADDGLAALRRARESAFDLLLLDARMPGLDGPAVLARVRAHDGPSQRAAALATTADDSPATAATLLASGFADVLRKPLRVDALREAVARHLPPGAATERPMPGSDALDDEQARRAAGGDMAIVAALRALFVGELAALPAEIEAMAQRDDRDALRERLHRLDASAGFCGVPALIAAAARLRSLLDGTTWPTEGIADFLAAGERARTRLSG